MDKYDIYRDIAERTDGDIYIGVVGPVRTGKSTFIKRFMDLLVLPNMENENERERTKDELPQSANGRTIMTTEPKFIPNEAALIRLGDSVKLKVRMIDCVGYLVNGAEGHMDGDSARMVNTPWTDKPIPFVEAAEMGTEKVINDHSTIGIVVTTDGSITDIPRENYESAEERVVNELKSINKPYIILLNTEKPYSTQTEELKNRLAEKYSSAVIPVNCAQLKEDDITNILETVLEEFPVMEIRVDMPGWLDSLPNDHWLKCSVIESFRKAAAKTDRLKTVKDDLNVAGENEYIKKLYVENIDMGTGTVDAETKLVEELFYKILSETVEMPVNNDAELIDVLKNLVDTKRQYDKYERAFSDADARGYGIVMPSVEGVSLEKPEMFKQGSRYGVRLKARGEAVHIIKTDVETRVEQVIGTEEQSRGFIDEIIQDFDTDPNRIWQLNIFGRTLDSLINEGLYSKAYNMPDDAQVKLKTALQKILNEGSGGLICIIL